VAKIKPLRTVDFGEMLKLTQHHARDISALKAVHVQQLSSLTEHHAKEMARLKREIAHLKYLLGVTSPVTG
jgi:hypothetical protein